MKKILLILFSILYLSVALVSTWHAIAFFGLSNNTFMSILLAVTFEVGQAAVLFALLSKSMKNNWLPWSLMGVLTAVQVLGNVFSSYRYMVTENADQISFFTKSVLFFVQSPNPDYNYVMISYITGAILPIVSLCMTAMVVNITSKDAEDSLDYKEEPIKITETENNDNTEGRELYI